MDPKERELLEETLSLARENNEMLHSIERSMRLSRVFRILYWALIIGSAIGAYYYFQDSVQSLFELYNKMLQVSADFSKIGDTSKEGLINIFNRPVAP
ncbi:MAG: hypothetical protein A2408_02875 [Candidatus Yonathbacteria bacterium RIFOXYC1_FULL_52_10]|uniref:Uncharacterized protein n=1 Tax=Candidatus Yonathbacteria bacterium RIFOXYD1_FULL_52_36 TaxID=1802730 RepID=A0A1G2SNY8_9BACT|nr:MAG: hypothetical protein A2408_02875 [Candidatus Yonathbacteria bacterium RIFOXYC1_FULL_52_10]OHA86091.1 MAG: hypothetical protein A2591_03455 [Candidatus Yonathbacteria bacterium RIFOXYD1_FULL_52_36]